MFDSFHDAADNVGAPARRIGVLLPSDTADLGAVTKGIYVGTGGDLAVIAAGAPDGAPAVVFRNVPSGALLPVRARRVPATGTSAADLVALL